MTKDNLPAKIDPFRFAENSLSLQGSLPIKNMDRLSTSLVSMDGEAVISLAFGIDEEGIKYVQGHLESGVKLQCQRCLEPFDCAIISDFALGIVHSDEEAEKLPERYDALIAKDNSLVISDMIEEELIVSLPIVPMHDMANCNVKLPFVSAKGGTDEMEKQNPFQVIEKLRSGRKE